MRTLFPLQKPAMAGLALATLSCATFGSVLAAKAATGFGQQDVDQNRFAVIASPYGGNAHQLLIVEQINDSRRCWSESGTSPTIIDPLLATFDFTGVCGRSIDSNGYSMRVGGEDLNWRYNFRVVRDGNNLLLLGTPTTNRNAPNLVIGRTQGYTSGFAKFNLEPGWRVAKRTYDGAPLGHVYLTNTKTLAALNAEAGAIATRPTPTPPVTPQPPVVTQPPVTTPSPVVTQPPVTPKPPVTPPVATQPTPATNPPKPTATRKPKWWETLLGIKPKPASKPATETRNVSNPTSRGNVVVPVLRDN